MTAVLPMHKKLIHESNMIIRNQCQLLYQCCIHSLHPGASNKGCNNVKIQELLLPHIQPRCRSTHRQEMPTTLNEFNELYFAKLHFLAIASNQLGSLASLQSMAKYYAASLYRKAPTLSGMSVKHRHAWLSY